MQRHRQEVTAVTLDCGPGSISTKNLLKGRIHERGKEVWAMKGRVVYIKGRGETRTPLSPQC